MGYKSKFWINTISYTEKKVSKIQSSFSKIFKRYFKKRNSKESKEVIPTMALFIWIDFFNGRTARKYESDKKYSRKTI